MSTKIFGKLYCKSMINPKHIHLHPSFRSIDKNAYYTKFGDNGLTKIYHGELHKSHIIFEAIGATEELNAFIGLAREFVLDDEKLNPLADKLRKIQLVLIDAVDIVSSLKPHNAFVNTQMCPEPPTHAKITRADIADLEALIAHYGTLLPQVEKVIVPGGGKASASLHVAKSACRRCERVLMTIFKDMNGEKNILTYINRLSSYLTQAARIAAKFANRSESVYKPHAKPDSNVTN